MSRFGLTRSIRRRSGCWRRDPAAGHAETSLAAVRSSREHVQTSGISRPLHPRGQGLGAAQRRRGPMALRKRRSRNPAQINLPQWPWPGFAHASELRTGAQRYVGLLRPSSARATTTVARGLIDAQIFVVDVAGGQGAAQGWARDDVVGPARGEQDRPRADGRCKPSGDGR